MENMTIPKILTTGLLSLLLACNAKEEKPMAGDSKEAGGVDKEQIKKEIQAKEDEFAATYNAGVLKNIGYYADDATSFYQNRKPLVGKEEIIEFFKSDLSTNANKNKVAFKTNEVFVSNDGNQVVEIGFFQVVDSTNTTINRGNYMSLFEKRNGKYVCVRDMSASDITLQ